MECQYCMANIDAKVSENKGIMFNSCNAVQITIKCPRCGYYHIIEYYEPSIVHYWKED